MFLMLNLLVFSTVSLFSISEADKRAIRKELYLNYENDSINRITLAEDGLSLLEVIDRDIEILSEHKDLLENKISFCKSAFKTDLFLGSIVGGISVLAGLSCVGSFTQMQERINKDYVSGKTGSWFIDKVVYNALSSWNYNKFVKENAGDIVKSDSRMKELSNIMGISALMTAVFGVMFLKKAFYICSYARSLNGYIQKLEKHFWRDQAIILELKEIK